MPTRKLTIRTVDAAVATGKDTLFWDSDLKGFGLKVTLVGTKTYVVQYRLGEIGRVARSRTNPG